MTGDTFMYKKVLIPLDGSEIAEILFAYAKELAGRLNLDILLLHVCTPEEYELHPMHRMYVEHAVVLMRQHYLAVRAHASEGREKKQIYVRGILAIGSPAEEILRCADDNNVDLIIMAAHGHSPMKRWSMGSVAAKVLRTSRVPVWLIRAGIPYEVIHDRYPRVTVLVPLDGSELAEVVFPHLEALAEQRGIERVDVALLRVCEPIIIPPGYEVDVSEDWASYVEQHLARAREEAEKYLADVAKGFEAIGMRVKTLVKVGQPAEEIIAYADAHPLNLVVMSTHGWSGHSWWPWGSVTGKVLENISSPLLLVRPQKMGTDYLRIIENVKEEELSRSV
jgi:nucleotide-binding universal stress UspA family protein